MRYIDADALLSKLPDDLPYKASVKRVLIQAQEADVVPKSEYEEVLSNWQKIHDSYTTDCIDHYNKGRTEVAREIFEELEAIPKDQPSYVLYVLLTKKIAELKKKYESEGGE